jgi:hypothetical protein
VARTASTVRTQIEALQTALSQGAVSISYEGRTVTYRSVEEMERALSILTNELAGLEGRPKAHRRKFAEFDRGYRR